MKRFLRNTLLLGSFLLLASAPASVKAANNVLYMPRVDAFTLAVENNDLLPTANEYTNMIIADVDNFVNVRTEPSTEAGISGRLYAQSVAKIIKYSPIDASWIQIQSGDVTGYVKSDFFLIGSQASEILQAKADKGETLTYAVSMDEIIAQIKAQEALKKEQQKAQQTANPTVAAVISEDSAQLRQNIVDYALQYVGNPYVHGGNSLTTGTDCSGFTSLIFAEFGYSLSRTPSGQLSSNGKKIEYSAIQPGDIICYSSNGKTCTHVAIYIGDGQVVHAANSKKGIIIGQADYNPIIGVKNVID